MSLTACPTVCPAATGELDFHAFATLASRFIVEEDPNKLRDELRQAFLFFDRDGEY